MKIIQMTTVASAFCVIPQNSEWPGWFRETHFLFTSYKDVCFMHGHNTVTLKQVISKHNHWKCISFKRVQYNIFRIS